ncbi:hypothetical protein N9023_07515, partial [Opitutaceae bacterium]|nr:hypothetical protein [Opitutaceae bacterium]
FSLVEVVVAIGVFVAGVVAAVALLSQTTNSAGQRLSESTAQRVADSSAVLIRQLSWNDVLARVDSDVEVFANRDGNLMGWVDTVSEEEGYFVMTLTRDTTASVASNGSEAYLALQLELRWPLRQDGTARVAPENQEVLRRRLVVNR